MLKSGKVIAEGTPSELKSALGGDWLEIVLHPGVDTVPVEQIVQQVASGAIRIDRENNRVSVPVTDRTKSLIAVATALAEARIEPQDIALRRPTLDEVFIHLTTEADKQLEVAA
jgi:ABC-2 type transport system ATP-binding protein